MIPARTRVANVWSTLLLPLAQAEDEVCMLSSLSHINIVRYLDYFCDSSGHNFIVTEFAEVSQRHDALFCFPSRPCPTGMQGGDLDRLIRRQEGLLSEEQVLHLFVQLLLALQFVHSRGVLHRDIKCSK